MEDLFDITGNEFFPDLSGNSFGQGFIGGVDVAGNGFLHDLLSDHWFCETQSYFDLSDGEIRQSVHEASEFFNLHDPLLVREYKCTGVLSLFPDTDRDDILVFSRDQMQDLGITGKEAFDLVMTHECGHRMLQDISSSLPPQQEELCCDFLSGVRAGLNDIDITQLENALADLPENSEHPIGSLRVEAVGEGRQFAEQYMAENGHAPTFEDCYEHFRDTFPETLGETESHDANGIKEYTQAEIDRHVSEAKQRMNSAQSKMRHYEHWLNSHPSDPLNSVLVDAKAGLRNARHDYEEAKADYEHWKYVHPDPKKFADTEPFAGFDDTLHEYSPEVARADAKVNHCQSKVDSLYGKMQSAKSEYGTDSSEFRSAKRAFDEAQSDLKEAREDYKRAVQNAYRNGTL